MKLDMQHLGLCPYKVYSNDDPGLTLTFFTVRSNMLPNAFVWENAYTLDFIETIEVYELKNGVYSRLSKYLNTYEYQRTRSLFDFGPRSLRFNFFNISCSH